MSNIYNRRLDYQVTPTGKPFLQQQKTTVYPEYAVVGNTKPNLDYKTNRILQPLFQTKKPIPQGPFNPKQPIDAHGLGGRKPVYIDYVSQPLASFKTRPPKGLLWEPNSIRETRQNVWPDGVPKNLNQLQQADSQYLENLNNEKKQKQLQERYEQRSRVGGHDGSRPHPTPSVEEELKRLDELLAETKYGKGASKFIGLNAEQHRQMAEKQAEEIKKELADLKKLGLTSAASTTAAGGTEPIVSLDPKDYKKYLGDPKELDIFVKGYLTDSKDDIPTSKSSKSVEIRQLIALKIFSDNGLDIKDPKNIKAAETIAKKSGQGKQLKTFSKNVLKSLPKV